MNIDLENLQEMLDPLSYTVYKSVKQDDNSIVLMSSGGPARLSDVINAIESCGFQSSGTIINTNMLTVKFTINSNAQNIVLVKIYHPNIHL